MKKQEIDTDRQLEDAVMEMGIVAYLANASYIQVQEVRTRIKTQYFYHDAPRHIYQIILYLNDKGEKSTPALIYPEVMRRGKISVEQFGKVMMHQADLLSYTELLQHLEVLEDYAKRREIWLIGQRLIKEGTCVGAEIGKTCEEIKKDMDKVIYDNSGGDSVSMQDVIKSIQMVVEDNMAGKNKDNAITSGFDWIDKRGGICSTDLNVIAAESSCGKTSYAISLALNLINQGKDVLFFSTEMTKEQITARLLSHYTKLYSSTILRKALNQEQLSQFDKGVGSMWESSQYMHFHDRNTSNINEILQSIRKHYSQFGIKCVFVDFLQRLTGRNNNDNDDTFYGRVSQQLKDLALELNICIILLSQLNRNIENNRDSKDDTKYIPMLNRMRGSGQIVEAADNVWFIYRPDYYNKEYGKNISYPAPFANVNTEGTAMIICAKGRNVGTGSFIVGFDANTTHFYDLEGNVPLRGVDTTPIVVDEQKTNDQTTIQSTLPF